MSDGRIITRVIRPDGVDDVYEVKDRDGTTRDVQSAQLQYPPTYALGPDAGGSVIDALTAAQYGLFQVVRELNIRSVDRTTYLTTGKVEQRIAKFESVFFDWPNPGPNDTMVVPSATIRLLDDGVYDSPAPSTQYDADYDYELEDGKTLLLVATLRAVLLIDAIFGEKDDRAACRRAFEDALLNEPSTDERGRRVKIDRYHNQLARYQLTGFFMPDDADVALAKQWTLVARVECEIPVVRLVVAPAPFAPVVDIEVGTTVDLDC